MPASSSPPDRLPAVVDWLVARFRARAATTFGLPEGEDLRVSLVSDQPWSGYNWYDGGRRSRVDINIDLPVRARDLVHTVAHETYPGHHLEHAWKEADLVDAPGALEASVLLINTPECLISEGLADARAPRSASPDGARRPAGRASSNGRARSRAGPARGGARRGGADRRVGRRLGTSSAAIAGNAALLRHADGRSHDEVLEYLLEVGRMTPERAAKRLEFIEHPLWRTYVFVYTEGEALLDRWLGEVPEARNVRSGSAVCCTRRLTPADLTAAGLKTTRSSPSAS